MTTQLSNCCRAEVKTPVVSMQSDTEQKYICIKCDMPCVICEEVEEKVEESAAEKILKRGMNAIIDNLNLLNKLTPPIMNNYEHHSHTHCFDQKDQPACGIPLEKHTQCCLCDVKCPTNVSTVDEMRKEFENWYRTSDNVGSKPTFDYFLTHASNLSDSTLREVKKEIDLKIVQIIEDYSGDKDRCYWQCCGLYDAAEFITNRLQK